MPRTTRTAVTTQAHMRAARELVSDWHRSLGGMDLATTVAAALADAEAGQLLPGERQRAEATVRVTGMVWRGHPELQAQARERVRADWARRLQQARMRPLGWPPITVTYWRWRELVEYVRRPDGGPPGMVSVDGAADADMVELTISGEAVAL